MRRITLSYLLVLTSFVVGAQTSSQRASVQINAAVQSSPARITLSWTSLPSTTSITIYRKLKSATSWGTAIATPAASDLSYADNSVSAGVYYEYRVVRVSNGSTGQGYIATGIEVPPTDFRGKLILLVDNTITAALAAELTVLERDLRADGWAVIRNDISPSASVTSVRSTVSSLYNADPGNVKAVYIVGHVPVPYSGNTNPDGHSEHLGAWPCDGYYAELDGSWTDAAINSTGAQRPENRNIPGDGKFDQSNFPSNVELQIGRVDLSNMPAFSASATELTRGYLNKAHDFKMKGWVPQVRGLMFDNLQWVGNPLAASGWRAMAPLVGATNITNANQNGFPFYTLVDGQSYLWTYSSGGGLQATDGGVVTYNGATNIGTTQNFAGTSMRGVFNLSFGSYFGDWDNRNNFLRAPLASGQALTNCWSAIPGWYFHHMGMGDNIGYSTLLSMNNSSLYTPLTDGWQGSIGRAHLGLMGDPSLRMSMLAPPSNLSVTNSSGIASFAWSASPEAGLAGYHIYEFAASGAITRLTAAPVTGTTHLNPAIPFVAGKEYMVRAVKLEVSNSGSYYNLSLGSIATAAGAPAVDCQGVSGGTAIPGTACNDGNACTTNDTWNANCVCTGVATSAPAITSVTSNGPICVGQAINLGVTATGAGPLTYAWTGPNGFTSSSQNPSVATATTAASGQYTITVSNSCGSAQQTVTVAVNTAPSATIAYVGTPFCTSAGTVSVTRTGASGGSYSVSPAGLTINTFNGNVTPSSSTPGTYTVTYTVAAAGGCGSTSTTASITINSTSSATIAYNGNPFCAAAGAVSVTRTGSAGGAYSASPSGLSINASTGAITPSSSTPGTYTVTYAIAASSGCAAFSTTTTVTIQASSTWYQDTDGDGAGNPLVSVQACAQPSGYVANANDACPADPSKISPGACGCGVPEGSCQDCLGVANGTALPGTSCNDNNANTINDVWNASCQCAGTPVTFDCLGVANGTALPGTPCDDSNAATGNDTWNASCQCVGQVIDCMGTPGGSALPGTSCNDNDANTINDVWNASCQCAGTPVTFDCLGVANGTALPGTPCDDGNAATGNDTWNASCQCVGQVIDCLGTPGGSALPGTSCNDNNANTINDVWNASCQCAGTPVTFDCLGVANGTALPGTACNDGNPFTTNDYWNTDCFCVGELSIVDCAGVPGGNAFIDECGICAGGTTGITPDSDADGDGLMDCQDNCSHSFNPGQDDYDGDGIGDSCDNCVWVYNPDQADSDGNGQGDACGLATGVAEDAGEGEFHLAPNPAHGGLVRIRFNDQRARVIRMHDALGAQVFTAPWHAYVDIDALASGVYIVLALDAEGRPLAQTRFVKQ